MKKAKKAAKFRAIVEAKAPERAAAHKERAEQLQECLNRTSVLTSNMKKLKLKFNRELVLTLLAGSIIILLLDSRN